MINLQLFLFLTIQRVPHVPSILIVKYLFVREKIALSYVSVEYIPTELMLADPLTKALAPKVFREHVTHMGLLESTYIC